MRSHDRVTETLSESAGVPLREAMASPTARGQWGERMAADVLRLAGFVENVNYVKQTQLDGAAGRPDFTFPLPKGHELYMDVKFPMAGYLRYLDADTDAERQKPTGPRFLRDVRARVKELAKRDYARESARKSVDYVLLFLPNEQLTGFIHEGDPGLIDDAMTQRVVMCSPLTLFAFLGVIRQAYDNFVVEQTSDQILALIGSFGNQWQKYSEQLDKVKNKFDQLDRQFDDLVGTRKRQLGKATPAARSGAARAQSGDRRAAVPDARRYRVRRHPAERPPPRRLTTTLARGVGSPDSRQPPDRNRSATAAISRIQRFRVPPAAWSGRGAPRTTRRPPRRSQSSGRTPPRQRPRC